MQFMTPQNRESIRRSIVQAGQRPRDGENLIDMINRLDKDTDHIIAMVVAGLAGQGRTENRHPRGSAAYVSSVAAAALVIARQAGQTDSDRAVSIAQECVEAVLERYPPTIAKSPGHTDIITAIADRKKAAHDQGDLEHERDLAILHTIAMAILRPAAPAFIAPDLSEDELRELMEAGPTGPVMVTGEPAWPTPPLAPQPRLSPEDVEAGWIQWTGGERPVDRKTTVEYRMRSDPQRSYGPILAEDLHWPHRPGSSDIIAYRPRLEDAEPEPAETEAPRSRSGGRLPISRYVELERLGYTWPFRPGIERYEVRIPGGQIIGQTMTVAGAVISADRHAFAAEGKRLGEQFVVSERDASNEISSIVARPVPGFHNGLTVRLQTPHKFKVGDSVTMTYSTRGGGTCLGLDVFSAWK